MNLHLTEPDMDALDFSKDSRIKESLLVRIRAEYFGELDENQLELVSAAGNANRYASITSLSKDGKKDF